MDVQKSGTSFQPAVASPVLSTTKPLANPGAQVQPGSNLQDGPLGRDRITLDPNTAQAVHAAATSEENAANKVGPDIAEAIDGFGLAVKGEVLPGLAQRMLPSADPTSAEHVADVSFEAAALSTDHADGVVKSLPMNSDAHWMASAILPSSARTAFGELPAAADAPNAALPDAEQHVPETRQDAAVTAQWIHEPVQDTVQQTMTLQQVVQQNMSFPQAGNQARSENDNDAHQGSDLSRNMNEMEMRDVVSSLHNVNTLDNTGRRGHIDSELQASEFVQPQDMSVSSSSSAVISVEQSMLREATAYHEEAPIDEAVLNALSVADPRSVSTRQSALHGNMQPEALHPPQAPEKNAAIIADEQIAAIQEYNPVSIGGPYYGAEPNFNLKNMKKTRIGAEADHMQEDDSSAEQQRRDKRNKVWRRVSDVREARKAEDVARAETFVKEAEEAKAAVKHIENVAPLKKQVSGKVALTPQID